MRRLLATFFLAGVALISSMTTTTASSAAYCVPIDVTIFGDVKHVRTCVPCLKGMCPYLPVPPLPGYGGPSGGAVGVHVH